MMASPLAQQVLSSTRWVTGFPRRGVAFADLTPVFADASLYSGIVGRFSQDARYADVIAGIDARGFILAGGVAAYTGKGVVALRKAGKLPPPTLSVPYALEYGHDALTIPAEGLSLQGQKVFVIDDVLATGGTLRAAHELVERAGGTVVGCGVVLELPELGGRRKLLGQPVLSIATA